MDAAIRRKHESASGATKKPVIAFDTHLLVRLFVQDDPKQFSTAAALLEAAAEADEPCYLSGARARHLSVRVTYTFDRKLRYQQGFTHLS